MDVVLYQNHIPSKWLVRDSFLDRNPNISYLVSSNGESVLIDASGDVDRVIHDLEQRQSSLKCILITHNHWDHMFTLPEWKKKFPDVRIGVYRSSLAALSRLSSDNLFALEEGMVIGIGGEGLQVIHTPGHTYDSVSFLEPKGNLFFSGDTLFGGGIGCSDYTAGGNRNIFYQTIVKLLEKLPASTRIYPGHYSEYYQTPPPHELAEEKIKNPYISKVIRGMRCDFDEALKAFSIDFEVDGNIMVSEAELDMVMDLERAIWSPELQASKETILTRLQKGHRLLAVKRFDELIGMIGWCCSEFSVQDSVSMFPTKFSAFSNCDSCDKTNAHSAFIYSLGVKPAFREKGVGSLLLQWAFEKIRDDGICQVFVDSRIPSYNGSYQPPYENIQQNPEFKEAIDRFLAEKRFPVEREFALDPRVRLYLRNGFKPWFILRDFIQDVPSNNMRVICFVNLEQDEGAHV